GRVFLFAYNGHIRTGPFAQANPMFTALGQHVREALGSDLFAIGSVFGQKQGFPPPPPAKAEAGGASSSGDPDSVNALMAQVGPALYFADLHTLPKDGPARQWWSEVHSLQSPEFINKLSPTACFDALIFTQTATPVTLLK